MKKLLSLFCTLSLSAALLAGCSGGNGNTNAAADGAESTSPTLTEPETTSQQETAAPVDVNVMALKGPTAMGMVEFMSQADTGELTDNNYHFSITAATDEVSAALAQGTTDLAAVPANLASVLYNNTEGGVQVLAINTLCALHRRERRYRPLCGGSAGQDHLRQRKGQYAGVCPQLCADPERH